MAAKILQQKQIGNELVWFLSGCYFSKNGVQFKVTGTETTGPGVHDSVHTIKNVAANSYAYIPMPKLIQILLTCE